jgi:hypothetical protein
MDSVMSTQTNYRVEFRDLIRKRSSAFFQRTDRDGIKETTKLSLDGELLVELRNRRGKWRIQEDAVKIEFGQPDSPDFQDLRKLVEQYPEEVTFTLLSGAVLEDGTSCSRLEAKLSPKLVSTLAGRLRAEWKAARYKSGADPLEIVLARRQYLIGQQDSLFYGTKAYDGNGDLAAEIVVISYQLGLSIPDEVFEVPEGMPVFIARSSLELEAHKAKLAQQRNRTLWDDLKAEILKANTAKKKQQKETEKGNK